MTDDIPSLTLKVLQDIRSEVRDLRNAVTERFESLERSTNTRFESLERSTNARFESLERSTNARFESLERVTALGFQRVTERLEHLRDFAGDRYRDHEARIIGLEQRMARVEHE